MAHGRVQTFIAEDANIFQNNSIFNSPLKNINQIFKK